MTEKQKVHFVGVGGIGMSGLAEILLALGYRVSGSDLRTNAQTARLSSMGAEIQTGHRAENLGDAQVVVFSSAIAKDNAELVEAKKRGLTILARAEMLAELMRKKRSVVVAGSHGKTTTTAMITTLFLASGIDPTAVIGGCLKKIASNARMGSDDWFICESDESDGSFLKLLPQVAVITNVDAEHLDHYGSFDKLKQAFVEFGNHVPFDGVTIVCSDDLFAGQIVGEITKPVLLYGIKRAANVVAKDIEFVGDKVRFSILRNLKRVCQVTLPVTGIHNVFNALATATVGLHIGLEGAEISRGLESFSGIERRMELKGSARGVRVIDDYAHHPTEIRATLDSLRHVAGEGRLRILFQPHRFSRVRDLWDEFKKAFDGVDTLVLLPIYAASEKPIPAVASERLVKEIRERKRCEAHYAATPDEAIALVAGAAKKGDVVVTMGAGDVTYLGARIVGAIEERGEAQG